MFLLYFRNQNVGCSCRNQPISGRRMWRKKNRSISLVEEKPTSLPIDGRTCQNKMLCFGYISAVRKVIFQGGKHNNRTAVKATSKACWTTVVLKYKQGFKWQLIMTKILSFGRDLSFCYFLNKLFNEKIMRTFL